MPCTPWVCYSWGTLSLRDHNILKEPKQFSLTIALKQCIVFIILFRKQICPLSLRKTLFLLPRPFVIQMSFTKNSLEKSCYSLWQTYLKVIVIFFSWVEQGLWLWSNQYNVANVIGHHSLDLITTYTTHTQCIYVIYCTLDVIY